VRRLVRDRGCTTSAVLRLGLGIGAGWAIISVVNAASFRPPRIALASTQCERIQIGTRPDQKFLDPGNIKVAMRCLDLLDSESRRADQAASTKSP